MVSFIDALISGTLFLTMLGIGMSLTTKDFKRVIQRPKGLGLGILLQIIAFPLFAFLIVYFWDLDPLLKVGIIIIAACPGGTTSNFISYLVRANVPLSISMTTVNSFITLFSIPLFVNIALDIFLGTQTEIILPIGSTIGNIIGVVLVPVFLGVWINEKYNTFSSKHRQGLKIATIILLASVFIIKFVIGTNPSGGLTAQRIFELLPLLIILNVGGLFLGYWTARLTKRTKKTATTIGIEVGLQNITLALLVASLLNNEVMAQPALIYVLFSFWTTIIFGIVMLTSKGELRKDIKKVMRAIHKK